MEPESVVAALSRALIPPVPGKFAVRDSGSQLTTPDPELATYWVVAQDPDGTVVFYDEALDEFGSSDHRHPCCIKEGPCIPPGRP